APAAPAADGYVAPRTEVERIVAAAWAEALGADRIGVEDNFFERGGDSILSIRVVSRLRAELGVELSPRALFATPTVAGLAATAGAALDGVAPDGGAPDGGAPDGGATDRRAPDGKPGPAVAIPTVSRDRDLPLSFAQQRLWLLDQFE